MSDAFFRDLGMPEPQLHLTLKRPEGGQSGRLLAELSFEKARVDLERNRSLFAEGIHRPLRVGHYDAGAELVYSVTGVAPAMRAQVRLSVMLMSRSTSSTRAPAGPSRPRSPG